MTALTNYPPYDGRNDSAPGTFSAPLAYTSAATQLISIVRPPRATVGTSSSGVHALALAAPAAQPVTAQRQHRPLTQVLLLALAAILALLIVFEVAVGVEGGRGGSAFSDTRGFTVQHGWLCYGAPDGALHCTQYWTRIHGYLVSENPGWVPNLGAAATLYAQEHHTSSTSSRSVPASSGGASSRSAASTAPAPAHIGQWVAPPQRAWRMWDLAAIHGNKSALFYPFGQCTWLAAYLGHGNLTGMGNAKDWIRTAIHRGMATGSAARVGATVVFQGGAQGASMQYGHVAHVIAVYANGWFEVEEMNFGFNGGGNGIVSYRYAHTGAGVSFIYA